MERPDGHERAELSTSLRGVVSICCTRSPSNRITLRAELFNRETMEETRAFLQIVANSALKHARSRVLMSVHSSNPVFTVERSGFLAYFRKLAEDPEHRIALLGDSEELGISHQYVELIGRQHGVSCPELSR